MKTKSKRIRPHAELRYTFHGVVEAAQQLGVSATMLNFFLNGKTTSRPLAEKVYAKFPELFTPALLEKYGFVLRRKEA